MTEYDPIAAAVDTKKWFVGSEHGDDANNPEYRYDTEGWPYFVGIKEDRIGRTDFHIASGIQSLQLAKRIAKLHNDSLGK